MLQIIIPENNTQEREYIIKTIVSGFLGLKYSINTDRNTRDYLIKMNDWELVIGDGFFSEYQNAFSYLEENALPGRIIYSKNEFAAENDIPIIFGGEELTILDKKIICGIDIFGGSFFMLTRWEEYVNKIRDQHGRFPGKESIASKNGFLKRPIVNEYAELLWNMLVKLGYSGIRKPGNFELVLTHDVDALTYTSTRSLIGDLIKRNDIKLALQNSRHLLFKDPFDTYDYLMDVSERAGVRSHFYFMSTDSGRMYDTSNYVNRLKFKSTIEKIKKRGHVIGFHAGYYTYYDPDRWKYEKELLEKSVKQEVIEGRQHYLRMDISKTLRIWDNNEMKVDSTLGYDDQEGFRCGTGDAFPVFDFLSGKQLNLKERPLIIMDGTLKNRNYSNEEVIGIIRYYIEVGKKYNMSITLLFHNSSFSFDWNGYYSIYSGILNML